MASLHQLTEENPLRCSALVGGNDVLQAGDGAHRLLEAVEGVGPRIGLVPAHHAGPLVLGHRPGAGVGEQVNEHVLGPEKDWSEFVVTTTKDLAMSALALPGEMKKFMARAARGELEVRWRNLDDAARLVYKLGHQLIYTLIMLTGGVLGFVLDERGHPGKARLAAWIAVGAATLLVGSFVSMRGKLKRKRR